MSLQISPNLADRGIVVASRRAGAILLFGIVPAAVLAAVLLGLFTGNLGHAPMFDYHGDLWTAGRSILAGSNPYHTAGLADRLRSINAGHDLDPRFALPVYPAPALLAFTPLSLLPYTAAALIFFAILVAALIGSLRALDVRDWRCYGALFLSYPVVYGLVLGNVTPLLMLAAALAWRCRARPAVAGAAMGLAIAFKLILWPLLIWLVIAGRAKAALLAVVTAAGATVGCWAAIGFAGLGGYPHLLSLLSTVESHVAYSPYALAVSLGAARWLAASVVGLLGVAMIGAAYAQRRHEHRVFGWCLLAALVFSPVVWSHYYALLYLPIALRSPRLSAIWLVPALLWPIADPARSTAQIAIFMTLATVACALVMIERPAGALRDADART